VHVARPLGAIISSRLLPVITHKSVALQNASALIIIIPLVVVRAMAKKDGYRQQNVRQRQKLISIIDYDVCMTFY